MTNIRINQIKLPVCEQERERLEEKIKKLLRNAKGYTYRIAKKSIDARDKSNLLYIYTVDVQFEDDRDVPAKIIDNKNIMSTNETIYTFPHSALERKNRMAMLQPVVVGAGPAGYFAALYLARAGYCPIVLERGKSVEERSADVEAFWSGGPIDKNSNVSFGEGGAGTFSDGKLNTGIKDRCGRIQAVIRDFVKHGAPEEISYLNKPHIGTDELKTVLAGIRQEILLLGGEVRFYNQLVGIRREFDDHLLLSVRNLAEGTEYELFATACILAIGHSARDTFLMLRDSQIPMEPKAFALGLRIEHGRALIDRGQYGDSEQAGLLPAADYKMTYRAENGRSVYSFCMCPGGFVVNASSDENQAVVNGMSNHSRDERNSNSAIVVSVTPEDFSEEFSEHGVLSGVEFQKKYEALAYAEGRGQIPVQRFGDYEQGTLTEKFGEITPNIKGSYHFGNLKNCLPAYVNNAIINAVHAYDKKLHGFATPDAVLSGIESRTSSPVRIIRDEGYMSGLEGLFPCGEGAGYAGGITSAAVDGIKVAEAVSAYLNER